MRNIGDIPKESRHIHILRCVNCTGNFTDRGICTCGPAACHSKANKQARLVERNICFISDAGNWGVGWQTSVQRPTPPQQAGGESFCRQSWGEGTCRNSTVISDNHLQIGHRWSDQHHLDCFRNS